MRDEKEIRKLLETFKPYLKQIEKEIDQYEKVNETITEEQRKLIQKLTQKMWLWSIVEGLKWFLKEESCFLGHGNCEEET